jgi:hypothetical protein
MGFPLGNRAGQKPSRQPSSGTAAPPLVQAPSETALASQSGGVRGPYHPAEINDLGRHRDISPRWTGSSGRRVGTGLRACSARWKGGLGRAASLAGADSRTSPATAVQREGPVTSWQFRSSTATRIGRRSAVVRGGRQTTPNGSPDRPTRSPQAEVRPGLVQAGLVKLPGGIVLTR